MSVHVDVERQLPLRLGALRPAADAHTRVGEEQIDRAECVLGGGDQVAVALLGADVGGDGERAAGADLVEPVGHVARRRRLQIGDHHACAFGVESFGKCLADPASGPGDDRMLPHEFHAAKRRR